VTFLPEAEVIRKSLEKHIVGKRFKDVDVKSAGTVGKHRNRPEFVKALEGRKVEAVSRRGTQVVLELDGGTCLVVTFGGAGTVTRETANAQATPQTSAVLTFTTGGAIHLIDPGGEAQLAVTAIDQLDGLPGGFDALAGTFTWQTFGHHLVARDERLAVLLRDETFILGLGDMYADEILWSAGLAGVRRSNSLTSQEIRRLYRAVLEVLYEAVKQGGADDGEPMSGDPEVDESPEYVRIYGRSGEPCPRCRRSITVTKLDKDVATYHCDSCQT
jgi:formamidopyrimidine-DNA glycosylase